MTALGHAQAIAGKRSEAEKVINRLQQLSEQQHVSSFHVAVVSAGLGNRKLALDWLEKSRQERLTGLPFIKVDSVLKSLRSETRFAELAKSMGL